MQELPDTTSKGLFENSSGSGARTITPTVASDEYAVVDFVSWSNDSAPVGGGAGIRLSSATRSFSMGVHSAGDGRVNFPDGFVPALVGVRPTISFTAVGAGNQNFNLGYRLMKQLPTTIAAKQFAKHHPADNTAAVVTIAAATDDYHVIDQIAYSVEAASSLTVTFGGTTVYQLDIPAAKTDSIVFPEGLYRNKNEAAVVTVAAAGAGNASKVNVIYR